MSEREREEGGRTVPRERSRGRWESGRCTVTKNHRDTERYEESDRQTDRQTG